MSFSVFIHLEDAEKYHKELDREFRKVHDQTFEIDCNFDLQKGTHERQRCIHGVNLYTREENPKPFKFTHLNILTGKSTECIYTRPKDFEAFLEIPCHWDYGHMVQTERDIQEAAKRLGLQISTRKSW